MKFKYQVSAEDGLYSFSVEDEFKDRETFLTKLIAWNKLGAGNTFYTEIPIVGSQKPKESDEG